MNLLTKMPLRMMEILLESNAEEGSAIWSIEATIGDPRLSRVLSLNMQGAEMIIPGPKSEKHVLPCETNVSQRWFIL